MATAIKLKGGFTPLNCKVPGCPETTRQGMNKFKCWINGYCKVHAMKLVPSIYKKKYNPDNPPFRNRTRSYV